MWPDDDATPIEPALVARRTQNPIRNIVDQLKVQPHPDKPMISLALGAFDLTDQRYIHRRD